MDTFWWSKRPDENLFLEITRRPDIGTDLKAPLTARGGIQTPGYALVSAVQAGDVVVHYNSAVEQVVGVSWATGERFNQPIWWAARGTSARQAAAKPAWLPGLYVALEGYQPLATSLPITLIQKRQAALFAVRDTLRAEYPKRPLYFPWTPYQDSLRTFQSYLAKLPRATLDVLPEVHEAVATLTQGAFTSAVSQPEVDELERDIATATGRPRPPRKGQGFATDQEVKTAVEAYAMNAALLHYSELGEITDTSRNQSFDYVVQIAGHPWHVEVKGTTGDPYEILLTPNEVKHAHDYPHVALFVLSNIIVNRDEHGAVVATGGKASIFHPWTLDETRLSPLGYKYRLPTE